MRNSTANNAILDAEAVISSATERLDATVVSSVSVNGIAVVVSYYGEDQWFLSGQPTNKSTCQRSVDFRSISKEWRSTMKAIAWHYMKHGRVGKKRPSARSVIKLVQDARPFLEHLDRLKISHLSSVTPFVCLSYANYCKAERVRHPDPERQTLIKSSTLSHRLGIVETLFELSHFTTDVMPSHPWPDASATHLSGMTGRGTGRRGGGTPLIPDDVFSAIFRHAWKMVESADALLDTRDALVELGWPGQGSAAHRRFAQAHGWRNLEDFNKAFLSLRRLAIS